MRKWQLQKAKANLSELVRAAASGEVQEITVRGRPMAVVLSPEQYRCLRHRKPRLVDFLRKSPLKGLVLPETRDRSPARDVRI